jgi:hypothetical protein
MKVSSNLEIDVEAALTQDHCCYRNWAADVI